jgi:hypothetical protein
MYESLCIVIRVVSNPTFGINLGIRLSIYASSVTKIKIVLCMELGIGLLLSRNDGDSGYLHRLRSRSRQSRISMQISEDLKLWILVSGQKNRKSPKISMVLNR